MASDAVSSGDLARLLIVLPNWVGDVVLATPALRAIRGHLPDSEITCLMRPYVQDVLHACPWIDQVVLWPEQPGRRRQGLWSLAKMLRRRRFSAVLLMTNSFRTALLARLAGIPRRIGYARDYRSFLLTDTLTAPRNVRRFHIESMLVYYGRLARRLGCPSANGPLELFADPHSDAEVAQWWARYGVGPEQPVVVLNPGGAFGASKLYPPERFSEVGTRLAEAVGAQLFITAGPNDLAIARAVHAGIRADATLLAPPQLNLRLLKSVIARSDLLITTDTGPRHFAIAFNVPVVTIFGPTHPEWTETHFALERQVMIPVDCGPCQKPVCPVDHRCMTGIHPDLVIAQARALLAMRKVRSRQH